MLLLLLNDGFSTFCTAQLMACVLTMNRVCLETLCPDYVFCRASPRGVYCPGRTHIILCTFDIEPCEHTSIAPQDAEGEGVRVAKLVVNYPVFSVKMAKKRNNK